jgi:hypothetical protein
MAKSISYMVYELDRNTSIDLYKRSSNLKILERIVFDIFFLFYPLKLKINLSQK